MSTGYGTPNPENEPGSWPPPPSPAVWPPPPTGQSVGLTVPFKMMFARVLGSAPNFRVGNVSLGPQGVIIQGKAVIPYETQVPILIICVFIPCAFILGYIILEYAVRRDEGIQLSWEQVREVVFVPKKRQACIVYDAPNAKGTIKTFSLAFRLTQPLYDAFATTVQQYAPNRVREGKLQAWNGAPVWIFVGGIVLSLLIQLGLAAFHVGGR